MNPKIKKRWIAALTSRKYKQGVGALREKTVKGERFCCLGVLCDIAEQDGVIKGKPQGNNNPMYGYGRQGEVGYLPLKVREWAGINSRAGKLPDEVGYTSLACVNDSGKRFSTIAKLIEKYF